MSLVPIKAKESELYFYPTLEDDLKAQDKKSETKKSGDNTYSNSSECRQDDDSIIKRFAILLFGKTA